MIKEKEIKKKERKRKEEEAYYSNQNQKTINETLTIN
jgi:hypothetical protein